MVCKRLDNTSNVSELDNKNLGDDVVGTESKNSVQILIFVVICAVLGSALAYTTVLQPVEDPGKLTCTLIFTFANEEPSMHAGNISIWEGNNSVPVDIISSTNGTKWIFRNVTFEGGTPWDQLIAASHTINFTWDASYWPQFNSYLVTSIASVKNGLSNHYWEYWVNGELAPVGVNLYELKDGDAVEWKFVESTW
jgi:hypothetical protein